MGPGTRRQNATGDARAELVDLVRAMKRHGRWTAGPDGIVHETRPWSASAFKRGLCALSKAYGWEAATPDRIDLVVASFRQLLRDEASDRIQDDAIDDETACDVIWVMLANVMNGRDPLDTDILGQVVSGPGIDAIPSRTRQNWRKASPSDGGLSLFLDFKWRRDARAYLERTHGLTADAARARLRRLATSDRAGDNPVTVWPVSGDHAEAT